MTAYDICDEERKEKKKKEKKRRRKRRRLYIYMDDGRCDEENSRDTVDHQH